MAALSSSGHSVTVTTHAPVSAEAAAGYAVGCDHDNLVQCHALALHHYYSERSDAHDRAALTLFQKACDGSYAPSCNGLGVLYAEGRGVPKDQARAAVLFKRACDAGVSTACTHLAQGRP